MAAPLESTLANSFSMARQHLIDADGGIHEFGDKGSGLQYGRAFTTALCIPLFLNPELHAGEAYMNGTLTFEDGSSVEDLLLLFSINRAGLGAHASQKLLRQLWRGLKRWQQANPVGVAAAKARSHYDL